MSNTDQRGGLRQPPGGRPPITEERVQTQFRLTPAQRQRLAELGDGSMTDGIRLLVDGDLAAENLDLRRRLAALERAIAELTERVKRASIEIH
jgi:hypothetical protein